MSCFIPYFGCIDHRISWDLMGSVPKGEILSCAIFICSCYHLFDLCLTSRYFHYFCLLSSLFWSSTLSYDLPNPLSFCLSIFHPLFILWLLNCFLPYSIFHLMFLCSVSIIIFPPSIHYFLPSLSNLDNLTFHPLWLCESYFTSSILHHSPYYSESCSIKFFTILYLLPCL